MNESNICTKSKFVSDLFDAKRHTTGRKLWHNKNKDYEPSYEHTKTI